MLAHAAVVTPVVTAVWLTSMRKKWVGGIGSLTCSTDQPDSAAVTTTPFGWGHAMIKLANWTSKWESKCKNT